MADSFGSVVDYVDTISASHINELRRAAETGWIPANETWTRTAATTFTVPTDLTAKYQKGTKIKLTDTTTKYFYVVSSSYGAPNTTVTVTGGIDYSLVSTLSNPYYSYMENPQGFPAAFNYTPTGIAASNVTLTARFKLDGCRCVVDFVANFSGAITYTTSPTLPITASASYKQTASGSYAVSGVGSYIDSGTAYLIAGLWPCVIASATTFDLRKPDGTIMSASVPITWAASDNIVAHFEYEI